MKIGLASTADGYKFGYARVSTEDQRLDLQIDALKRAGVQDNELYVEKISGASKKRPQLDLVMKALRPGDILYIWRLDRLARSIMDLLRRVQQIEEAGATLISLTESFDTKTAGGRFLVHVLGAVAELERQLTIERTRAGVKSFMDKGGKVGAPTKMTAAKLKQARGLLLTTSMTFEAIAKKLKVSVPLLYQRFPGGRAALKAKAKRKL